ncbi:hypothetical protein [Filimonas effusa]|uniref:Uncharacterized protein n=1 Tax=Filimonas effusa TaxID=2508721 RepID=A0A4Q1DA11_9BACT|nr:hypothetical protein [Filimonas effusa]RXK85383.1 hypothetical protein ESB13_00730 [Filimonas effusa]
MRQHFLITLLLAAFCCCASLCQVQAQDSLAKVTDAYLNAVTGKSEKINAKLEQASGKLLSKMQRQETKLYRKLAKKDSVKARQMLESANGKYQQLQQKLKDLLNGKKIPYISSLDTMTTSLSFLKGKELGAGQAGKLAEASKAVDNLSGTLAQSEQINAFIKERQQQLKEQLSKYDMGKQLKSINKEVYYYQQQVQEYKALLKDRKKMEEKALGLLRESPVFKDFMKKNSYLSRLFPATPGSSNGTGMAGLQTRAQVQQLISQRLGASAAAAGGANPLQSQLQAAQGQLDQLKDKVNKLGGGSSDMTMPEGFKPNNQRTKSFLQRIEFGFNVQSQGSNNFLPSISDMALTAGYKLSDKSIIGLGASYKMGWGKPFNDIRLSSEGVGLRSFIDVKAKGSIWITGGYEMNYLQAFAKVEDLRKPDAWQKSGLLGLTKKYKIGKKQGNLQLLWDFLSYSQVPKAPALKFRVGYTL